MDVRKLQERLAETEAQMTKILAAMQAVQGKVDAAAKTSQQQDQDLTLTGGPSQESSSTQSQDTSNNQGSESCPQVADEEKVLFNPLPNDKPRRGGSVVGVLDS